MRRTTVLCCLLAASFMAAQRMPAQESGEAAKSPESAKPAEPPSHFYHLELVIEQVDADGKPTNNRSYSTIVSTARADNGVNTEIRTGAKVPLITGGGKEGAFTQYQYQDVGVKIDARNPRDFAGKLTLYLAATVTSVADGKEPSGLNTPPILGDNQWQGQVLIPIGKATTVFTSDDVHSKGSMRMVVTATLLQ